MEERKEEIDIVDSDVGEGITENTLNRLRDLGFNVTVVLAAKLTNDGKREHTKKLTYEKETSHEMFIEHLMAVRDEVPEVLSEAELRRLIERRDAKSNSVAYSVDGSKHVVMKFEVQVDPSQDLSFVFRKTQERGKRGVIIVSVWGVTVIVIF